MEPAGIETAASSMPRKQSTTNLPARSNIVARHRLKELGAPGWMHSDLSGGSGNIKIPGVAARVRPSVQREASSAIRFSRSFLPSPFSPHLSPWSGRSRRAPVFALPACPAAAPCGRPRCRVSGAEQRSGRGAWPTGKDYGVFRTRFRKPVLSRSASPRFALGFPSISTMSMAKSITGAFAIAPPIPNASTQSRLWL